MYLLVNEKLKLISSSRHIVTSNTTMLHLGAISEKSQSSLVLGAIRNSARWRIQEGTVSR
jgi:hypothetical protein